MVVFKKTDVVWFLTFEFVSFRDSPFGAEVPKDGSEHDCNEGGE